MKIKIRPDFSNYLAHFASDRAPLSNSQKNPTLEFSSMVAKDKLKNILENKKIIASKLPWTGAKATCFTECPWSSLLEHTNNYSPYGIGFEKSFIFSRNGCPVFYARGDLYKKQKWIKEFKPFVTPFWPQYKPKSFTNGTKKFCDYTHEREWRVPHDLPFEYEHIEFIILKSYADLLDFSDELKEKIGLDKFIFMDNYKMVEKLWPVHLTSEMEE